ncbi:MAG TPA: hypothetical protein VMI54_01255 [Polyangiaceae bacterium]|nr:hypothetical protein [Polyangiaceae bacterium]
MLRVLSIGWALFGVVGCGGGEVVAVKFVGKDANPSAYFSCTPDPSGTSFSCASGQAFHQYDREFDAGQACQYGIASVYVETSGSGKVTRLQYDCAVAPVTPFPDSPPPAPPPAPAPTPTGAQP